MVIHIWLKTDSLIPFGTRAVLRTFHLSRQRKVSQIRIEEDHLRTIQHNALAPHELRSAVTNVLSGLLLDTFSKENWKTKTLTQAGKIGEEEKKNPPFTLYPALHVTGRAGLDITSVPRGSREACPSPLPPHCFLLHFAFGSVDLRHLAVVILVSPLNLMLHLCHDSTKWNFWS